MTISPATDAHHDWCAQLMASSDPWLRLGRGYTDCLARCRHPEYTLLVAETSTGPLGFALVHPRGLAGSPYLAAIAVAPTARGQSVGSALLDAAEHAFPSRHFFLCVSSFNTRAQALYLRRGYTQVGELNDYVVPGASELLFHKCLVRP